MFDENASPSSLLYERCAAAFVSEEHGSFNTTVLPNVALEGEISGTQRQIDVLIDHRWQGGAASRIIVDAKNRSRPLDIGDVEQFEGMMRDCRASRGILVCTAGWTSGAQRRAQQAITITILDFEDALEEFGWAYEACRGPCAKNAGKRRDGVLWGEVMGAGRDLDGAALAAWTVIRVGKCDTCHSFHAWCWDCGEKFAIADGAVVTCGCETREWASVRESMESGHIGQPESIWLMMRENGGPPVAFDRRPIR